MVLSHSYSILEVSSNIGMMGTSPVGVLTCVSTMLKASRFQRQELSIFAQYLGLYLNHFSILT